MSYYDEVLRHIHFLESNVKKGNIDGITSYVKDLFMKISREKLSLKNLQPFFEAEGRVIKVFLEQEKQNEILSLVQAISQVKNSNICIDKIEFEILINVIKQEHKEFTLLSHPGRQAIMKNVLNIMDIFMAKNHENQEIVEKWDWAQKILNIEYPIEYRNILELYKITLNRAVGTSYSNKIQETRPPEDLSDINKVHCNLQDLSNNLDHIKNTLQEEIQEIQEEHLGNYEARLRVLVHSIDQCFLYIHPVLENVKLQSIDLGIENLSVTDTSTYDVEITGDYNQTKSSTDIKDTIF